MRERERRREEEFSGLTARPLFVFSCACHLHDMRAFLLSGYKTLHVAAFSCICHRKDDANDVYISPCICVVTTIYLVTSTHIISTFHPWWKQKYADRAFWISLKQDGEEGWFEGERGCSWSTPFDWHTDNNLDVSLSDILWTWIVCCRNNSSSAHLNVFKNENTMIQRFYFISVLSRFAWRKRWNLFLPSR